MGFIEIAKKTGRGLALSAALLAAGSLAAIPGTAYARDWHGGGHHWDGVIGAATTEAAVPESRSASSAAALAGAAIASAASPYNYNYGYPAYGYARPRRITRHTDRTRRTEPGDRDLSMRAALCRPLSFQIGVVGRKSAAHSANKGSD
jgi:hypothetical protein